MKWRLGLLLFLSGCVHYTTLAPEQLKKLPRTKVMSYVAEARLGYRGPKGRATVRATVAVQRPDRFRFDLYGPHGGILSSFATNGATLTWIDLQNQQFVHGDATADNIDKLLWFAPLHLKANEWVSLLLGEVDPQLTGVEYQSEPGTPILRRVRLGASSVTYHKRDPNGLPVSFEIEIPKTDLSVSLRDVDTSINFSSATFVLSSNAELKKVDLSQP
jgi:outer membrane lipoprotein-sorting protein